MRAAAYFDFEYDFGDFQVNCRFIFAVDQIIFDDNGNFEEFHIPDYLIWNELERATPDVNGLLEKVYEKFLDQYDCLSTGYSDEFVCCDDETHLILDNFKRK